MSVIIDRKINHIRKETPIVTRYMNEILADMVRESPDKTVRFEYKIAVPAYSGSLYDQIYNTVVLSDMTMDLDNMIVFHTPDGKEIYPFDVFNGIVTIFTMLDLTRQIKF